MAANVFHRTSSPFRRGKDVVRWERPCPRMRIAGTAGRWRSADGRSDAQWNTVLEAQRARKQSPWSVRASRSGIWRHRSLGVDHKRREMTGRPGHQHLRVHLVCKQHAPGVLRRVRAFPPLFSWSLSSSIGWDSFVVSAAVYCERIRWLLTGLYSSPDHRSSLCAEA